MAAAAFVGWPFAVMAKRLIWPGMLASGATAKVGGGGGGGGGVSAPVGLGGRRAQGARHSLPYHVCAAATARPAAAKVRRAWKKEGVRKKEGWMGLSD